MKRILCIISSLDAGGAETFLMKVCRALSPLEYQLDFVVSKDNGCYTEEVKKRGGKIFLIPTRSENLFGALNGIRDVVRQNKYECVLKLGEHSLAVLDLIAARFGGATILAIRACNAPTRLSFFQRALHATMTPFLNRIADVKIAPSRLAAEFLFGKTHDVHMLHNGVDLNVYKYDELARDAVRKEFEIKNKLVIGHIGRFHAQKNHFFLLQVFQKICALRDNAVLLLIGAGELKTQICECITSLGLDGKVLLLGQRFDIPQLLSAMDVFVFPSFHEGMPNTVIEAQATGLPCVIADTITPEADITGLVTYLSLDSSPEMWAEAALNAVRHERIETSEAFISNGYDIQSVAREFIRLFEPAGSCKN